MGGVNRLSPRIDCFEADFLVFSPIRDQAPAQAIESPRFGFGIVPDREDLLARRNVLTDGQIRLRGNRDMIDPR